MSTSQDAPDSMHSDSMGHDVSLLNIIGANWWILLLRGLLLVALGLYALFNPGLTLIAWAFMIGCFLVADGLLSSGLLIRVSGAFAILFGCVVVFSAFKLRKLKHV